MNKQLITTLTALIIASSQVLPAAQSVTAPLPETAITASAVDNTPAKVTGVKASKTGYTTTVLSWKKVSNAKGYRVYMYDPNVGKYRKMTTINKNSTTSYTVVQIEPGKTHKFKVRAYRKVGGKTYWGTPSAVLSVTTKSYAPAKVTGVKAELLGSRGGQLTWKKVSNASGYRIYLYNPTTKKYEKRTTIPGGSKTVCTFKGLTIDTEYKFKVRAYRKADGRTYWGTSSAAVKLKTPTRAEELKEAGEMVFYNTADHMKAVTAPGKISTVKKAYELKNTKILKQTDKEFFICGQLVVTVNNSGKDVVNYIPYACKATISKEGFPMVQTYAAGKWLTAPQIYEPATEYNEKMFDREMDFFSLPSPIFNTP